MADKIILQCDEDISRFIEGSSLDAQGTLFIGNSLSEFKNQLLASTTTECDAVYLLKIVKYRKCILPGCKTCKGMETLLENMDN